MPVGHDVRDFAEHKCGLSPVRLAGPHRLVHAEEFRREGGMELSVRVANDMSLVQRAGERRQLGPVAPPPEARHEPPELVEARAVLSVELRDIGIALEEHEEVVGRHVFVAVDFLHEDAAPARSGIVRAAEIVEAVPPQVSRCDARRRPRLECLGRDVIEELCRWYGVAHYVQRELDVVVPVLQEYSGSSA